MHCAETNCSALHVKNIAIYCTSLHCTAQQYTVIHCTGLQYLWWSKLLYTSQFYETMRQPLLLFLKKCPRDLEIQPLPNSLIHHSSKISFAFWREKTKLWLIIRRNFFQLTISLHNFSKKELFPNPIHWSRILIGGPPLLSLPFAITRLLLADHWAMLLPTPIGACRTWVPRHFTRYNAATPLPAASAHAVTCRRRRKSPLDGARDLLSQIGQHITTVSFV